MTDDSDPHPMTGAAIELAKERNELLEELEALADELAEKEYENVGANERMEGYWYAKSRIREVIAEYRGASDE